MRKSRGLRNNNPGNIRVSSNPWKGKITGALKKDKAFEEFKTIQYGYRALIKNLQTYITRDRVNTIRAIITKWAPASDGNFTDAYIRRVCSEMGVAAGYMVEANNRQDMINLAAAISLVENGEKADMKVIEEAWDML